MMNVSSERLILQSKDWKELKTKISKFHQTKQGEIFEDFCEFLILTNPTFYNYEISNIWNFRHRQIPIDVLEYLHLEPEDEGIDLIIETKDKRYIAIQCKFHDNENYSLTRNDLSTCLDTTFIIAKNIESLYIISNCNSYSHKFDKLDYPKEKISFLLNDFITENEKEKLLNVKNFISNKKVVFKPIQAAEYQKKSINKIIKCFKKHDRGKLIYPCGTGKSLVGFWIAKKTKSKNIIVCVPSLALINQLFNTWAREALANKWKIEWRAICSKENSTNIDKDDVSLKLAELPVKTLINNDEINSWLNKKSKLTKVTFITYQSVNKITHSKKNCFDLGIIDEAHRTTGGINNSFSKILFNKNVKIKKRLFMTATQRFYSGKSNKILGMDNEKYYGNYNKDGVFDEITFSDAIKLKRPDGTNALTDYQIIHLVFNQNDIANIYKHNLFVRPEKKIAKKIKWNKSSEASMLISGMALKKAIKKFKIKNTISFSSGIERSILLKKQVDLLNKLYKPKTSNYTISSRQSMALRKAIVRSFSDTKNSLITNARCLQEGVDIPKVDSVIFADPKTSKVDIVQAAGRALRPFKGKKLGYIIVPTVLNNKDKLKNKIEKSFENIMQTITAMGSTDSRIIDYFDSVAKGRRFKGRVPVITNISESLEIDIDKFTKGIGIKLYQRVNNLRGVFYTKDDVLMWADKFYSKYKRQPSHSTGRLVNKQVKNIKIKNNSCIDSKDLTWRKIDDDFINNRGDFTEGSLNNFLKINRPRWKRKSSTLFGKSIKINKGFLKNIIDNFYKKYKRYPSRLKDNEKEIYPGTSKNFKQLNTFLTGQHRDGKKAGLPATLAKFIKDEYNISTSNQTKIELTEFDIKKYIKEYYQIYNILPKAGNKYLRKNGETISFKKIHRALISKKRDVKYYKGKKTFMELLEDIYNESNKRLNVPLGYMPYINRPRRYKTK